MPNKRREETKDRWEIDAREDQLESDGIKRVGDDDDD
jgi:hypothetical protein